MTRSKAADLFAVAEKHWKAKHEELSSVFRDQNSVDPETFRLWVSRLTEETDAWAQVLDYLRTRRDSGVPE